MPELRDAVPMDLFGPIFEGVREDVVATNMVQLKKKRPTDVIAASLFVWDEMVHRGATKHPYAISPVIQARYKDIYPFVTRHLGRFPFSDIYSARYFNKVTPDYSFADVTLLQCYPNDIHIADVEFADTRSPVDDTPKIKGAWNYHGLHIFDEFIERLKGVARSRDVERISLVIGGPGLADVFARHGFRTSDTAVSQAAAKEIDQGYAMVLNVD